MPVTKPTPGGSNGTWGAELNAALTELDARTDPATLSATYVAKRANTAVLFGDSHMATNEKLTGTRDAAGSFLYYDARGWITGWANPFLHQRLEILANKGITGQASTEILARFDADVAPFDPSWVFISAVHNDVKGVVPLATIKANHLAMYDKCDKLGATPVVFTCPPLSSPSATTAQLAVMHGFNYWLKELATTRPNLIVIDVHPALSDATAADEWIDKNTVKYTADGTHVASWGAARCGRLIRDALDPLLPQLDRLQFSSAAGPTLDTGQRNLLLNPGMAGITGTKNNSIVGDLADSWTINSSTGAALVGIGTCAKVPRTDQKGGEWQQVNVAGTSSGVVLTQTNVQTPTYWDANDKVEAWVEFQGDPDISVLTTLRLKLEAWGPGGAVTVYGFDMAGETSGLPLSENPLSHVVFRTPPITIAADRTSLTWAFHFTGLGTFRIARPLLRVTPA